MNKHITLVINWFGGWISSSCSLYITIAKENSSAESIKDDPIYSYYYSVSNIILLEMN
jgi:hypothetical protein